LFISCNIIIAHSKLLQVRSIDSALLSAEDQDLADTEDTDSSLRTGRRRYRGPGSSPGIVSGVNSKLDEHRMTSARRANAVSAARRISSIVNLQQVTCSSNVYY